MSVVVGQKYGKLTVKKLAVSGNANQRRWLCNCDCGGTKVTSEDNLKRGHCKSCGCLLKGNGGKSIYGTNHGESSTRLYKIWARMKERCYLKSSPSYARYGGRGIAVCDEWNESFLAFKEWALSNGYNDSLTIDRIDNDMGYSPDNCRWATYKEQGNNRRTNRYESYNGKTQTVSQWAEEFGVPYVWLISRLRNGKTLSDYMKGVG